MFCVNVCELDWSRPCREQPFDFEAFIGSICNQAQAPACERLYIGSSFCSSTFFQTLTPRGLDTLNRFSDAYKVPVTLTLPIASQCELHAMQTRVLEILDHCPTIDEITVNDYGLLHWSTIHADKRINLGRLFSRELRDLRYDGTFPQVYQPTMLTGTFQDLQKSYPQVTGIEFDPAGLMIDVSSAPIPTTIAIHTPYCYITTGRYCPFAPSPDNEIPANSGAACSQQCCQEMTTYRLYSHDEDYDTFASNEFYFTQHGKTVYVFNPEARALGAPARTVYTPRHFGWMAEDQVQNATMQRSW